MDGRIARLRGLYRVRGAHNSAQALAARLDRVLRERVSESYETALGEAFAGDEAVYVLRRVEAKATLMVGADATDARLARRWGEHLAGAVVRSVAEDADDGANLVRFDGQPDYVASFAVALLDSTAWGRWYYGAFSQLQTLDAPHALGRALLDNRRHLPAILARLHSCGRLNDVLELLDAQTRRSLWRDESQTRETPDTDALRPLFAAAMELIDGLGAWSRTRRAGEELFRAYLDDAASSPRDTDWRDTRSLAAVVLDAVRFLFRRGQLRLDAGSGDGDFRAQLGRALEGFGWLDRVWLRDALLAMLDADGARAMHTSLPARAAGAGGTTATPRQRELLAALAAVLRDDAPQLDRDDETTADALRLFALLVSRAPQWGDDAAAKNLIGHLLDARRFARESGATSEFILRLRRRDVAAALRLLSDASRARAAVSCNAMSDLGESALALVEELAGEDKKSPLAAGVETECAGLALLWRAMLDARLDALAAETSYPPGATNQPAAFRLALALRLCGEATVEGARIDEGLRLLVGLDERATLDELRAMWANAGTSDGARFQAALLRAVAGLRVLRPSVMHVFRVALEDGDTALIAGDESGILWPLGQIIERVDMTAARIYEHEAADVEVSEATDIDEVETTVAAWLNVWTEATGVRPIVVFDDDGDAGAEELSVHESGRAALESALKDLTAGRLGASEADLTTALAACVLLRAWAHWLRQFSASGVPYLLENFVRRRGRVSESPDGLLVELERRPLDIVIEMAGYLNELERVPWLGGRRVRFRLRGA